MLSRIGDREESLLVRGENYSRSQILQSHSPGDYFIKSSDNHLEVPCLNQCNREAIEFTQPNTRKLFTLTQRSRVEAKVPRKHEVALSDSANRYIWGPLRDVPSCGPCQLPLQGCKWFGFATVWAEEEGQDGGRGPLHCSTVAWFTLRARAGTMEEPPSPSPSCCYMLSYFHKIYQALVGSRVGNTWATFFFLALPHQWECEYWKLTGPQFPHLQNWNNECSYLSRFQEIVSVCSALSEWPDVNCSVMSSCYGGQYCFC